VYLLPGVVRNVKPTHLFFHYSVWTIGEQLMGIYSPSDQ
jgi:hypothetical protein